MLKNNDVILVSSSNYVAHTKTLLNPQIITQEIASSGVKVLFIESLGLKTLPLVGRAGIYKVFLRLIDFIKLITTGVKNPQRNVYVLSLIRLPFENIRTIKLINELIITFFINLYSRRLLKPKPILWIFLPTANFLIDRVKHSISIYHSVDDYSEVPNVDKGYVLSEEKSILRKVDIIFTVSINTYNRFKKIFNGDNIYYLNNVARFKLFNSAITKKLSIPKDLKPILKQKKPIIGFMGNIASYKENLELILEVVRSTPNYNYVFIGPVGVGEAGTNTNDLISQSNVHFLGPKEYSELPGYFKYWDIAMITRRINKANEGGFPLKYFEYLSSGLPVITTGISSLKEFSNNPSLGTIADTQKEFVTSIDYWLNVKKNRREWARLLKERLRIAKQNSWEKRIKDFDRIISRYL